MQIHGLGPTRCTGSSGGCRIYPTHSMCICILVYMQDQLSYIRSYILDSSIAPYSLVKQHQSAQPVVIARLTKYDPTSVVV